MRAVAEIRDTIYPDGIFTVLHRDFDAPNVLHPGQRVLIFIKSGETAFHIYPLESRADEGKLNFFFADKREEKPEGFYRKIAENPRFALCSTLPKEESHDED